MVSGEEDRRFTGSSTGSSETIMSPLLNGPGKGQSKTSAFRFRRMRGCNIQGLETVWSKTEIKKGKVYHDMFRVSRAHPFPCRIGWSGQWRIEAIEMPVQRAIVAANNTLLQGRLPAAEAGDQVSLLVLEATVICHFRLTGSAC